LLTNAPIDPNRVAVYIRWSTDEQTQGTTLEVQREACQHFLKSQGWNYVEELVFVDDGYSGGNMDRPALARLRAAINVGDVAAVVVYKLDRLSRNLLDCVNLVRQEWAKVALFSTMERFDTHSSVGQMVFNILVSFAEFERNVIRDRMMSGKRKRWEQGRNSGFKYPYGYRRSATGSFEIDPAQAEVVRRMYGDYIQGAGFAVIRDRLNQEGIPAPSGGQWRICSIQLILKNPFYAGHMAAGYYSYEGGKQRRGKAPTRLLEDAVPAIIQQSVFDLADENVIEPRREVFQRMIRRIGAVDRGGNAALPAHPRHLERDFTVPAETHLGEKIEIVFADDRELWRRCRERRFEALFRAAEHHVAEFDADSGLPKHGGGEQRLERRIRLHLLRLLPVVKDVIAVSKKYASHNQRVSPRVRARGSPVRSDRRITSHSRAIEIQSSKGHRKKWCRSRQYSGLRSHDKTARSGVERAFRRAFLM
jgi:DNA invertase Pin-like site-specific DNA recombinase